MIGRDVDRRRPARGKREIGRGQGHGEQNRLGDCRNGQRGREHQPRARQKRGTPQITSPDPQSAGPRQMVRQIAASHIGDAGQQKGQCREHAAAEQREVQNLDQVRRQPGEIEIQPVAEAEIHGADRIEIAAAEEGAPGRAAIVAARQVAVLLNPRELVLGHRRMIVGPIAIPDVPRNRPDDADAAEGNEARAPAPARDQPQRGRRRQHPADPRAEKHDTVRAAAFADREPPRKGSRDVWKRARFAGAEQKSNGDERIQAARSAGQHREGRPPQDNPRENSTRTPDITEPARGHLEKRVGERERAEHDAHFEHAQMEIVHNERRRSGNADAIEVGHYGEQKRKREDPFPHAAGRQVDHSGRGGQGSRVGRVCRVGQVGRVSRARHCG